MQMPFSFGFESKNNKLTITLPAYAAKVTAYFFLLECQYRGAGQQEGTSLCSPVNAACALYQVLEVFLDEAEIIPLSQQLVSTHSAEKKGGKK